LINTIYGKKPEAALLSVFGYRFLFTRQLSEKTAQLVTPAVDRIWSWIKDRNLLDNGVN
jgi:hypothetical protein